jgi:hypothetical protein
VADTTNDKLLLGTDTINLNSTDQRGINKTIGTITGVDWSYSTGKELTISKTGGGAFTAAQVQAIAQALQFKTTAGATQGDRTFAISYIDSSGNPSTSATVTTTVDTEITLNVSALATPTVTIRNDTGTSSTDRITNDSLVQVSVTLASPLSLDSDEEFQVSADGGTTWVNMTNSSGNTWVTGTNAVTLSSGAGKSLTARIKDNLDNTTAVTLSNNSYTLDTTAPTLTITDNTLGSAGGDITFTFTFSEAVSGFDLSDIMLSAGTPGTLTNVNGDPTKYSLKVTPPSGSGTMTVDVRTGSFQDLADNTNTADTTANSQAYYVSPTGQSVISLGGYGNLMAPVQVEGKWYYYWDRNRSGTWELGGDFWTQNELGALLNKDINGNSNPGGARTDDTYRYGTINGVKLALPTAGGQAFAPYGQNQPNSSNNHVGKQPGTSSYYNSTTENTTYNDYLAIWDYFNGTGTGTSEGFNTTPPGWVPHGNSFWTSTPLQGSHASAMLDRGWIHGNNSDSSSQFVALQVL